jgi:hypothetical protein
MHMASARIPIVPYRRKWFLKDQTMEKTSMMMAMFRKILARTFLNID